MENLEFFISIRVIFGKETHLQVGEIIKEYGFHRVLVHFDRASAEKTGLLDAVLDALKAEGTGYVTLGGVQANPTLSTTRQGVELCLKEHVGFVLAAGGGSAVDSAKCIADGAGNLGVDVWSYFRHEAIPRTALPVGTILTLSASGSEMSVFCVTTDEEDELKRGLNSPIHRPLLSICNPELTYSVSRYQTGCGTADITMHTLERYFTRTKDTMLTDCIAEGILKFIIEAGRIADREPGNCEARATLTRAGSLSHNGLISAGRSFLMQVHQMEHELPGMYPQIAHGAGPPALWPPWARYVCSHNMSRFARYGVNVRNIDIDFENPMNTALVEIQATKDFYRGLGMPVILKELGAERDRIEETAEKCTNMGQCKLSGTVELGKEEMIEIYGMAIGE